MKVAVLGAGAIGGWLAGALAEAGVEVSLVARGATLAAIRSKGLRIQREGSERSFPLRAGSATELGVHDLAIVATKAQDVTRALPNIQPLLGPATSVVSALNGLPWWFTQSLQGPLNNTVLDSIDPGGAIAALLPVERSVGCVVHASTSRPEPGVVRIGKIDRLIFGEPGGAITPRVRWLAEHFAKAGIQTIASPQIRMETWAKLWGNMNMNPLSALTRATTGRMLDDPEIHALCIRMMEEMSACGERLGLPFPSSAPERMAVTRKLGDFKTSMLQDALSRAPLEYLPQLGAVVEIAQRMGIAAPYCAAVLGLVRQLSVSLQNEARA